LSLAVHQALRLPRPRRATMASNLSESSAINGHIAYLMVPLWINMDYIIWINMVYMVPIITYL
jgi:hypothetical protein